jgi:hypothetical protein
MTIPRSELLLRIQDLEQENEELQAKLDEIGGIAGGDEDEDEEEDDDDEDAPLPRVFK